MDGDEGSATFHITILVDSTQYEDFGLLTLEEDKVQEWSKHPPHGRIIECRWDPDWPNNWRYFWTNNLRFTRYRDDKLDANHISVFNKIMLSIKDDVTREQVCALDLTGS